MGDRYTLNIKCADCGTLNEDVYYAESSGSRSFDCEKCHKINWLSLDFTTRIVSKKEEKRLYKLDGFK